jgi:hypothetical protein
MFQFLILIIFVLFGAVELFQWLKGVMLPVPIYVLAGAFLAIASNYDRGMGLLFNQAPSSDNLMQNAVIIEPEPKVLTAESMESAEASVNMEES